MKIENFIEKDNLIRENSITPVPNIKPVEKRNLLVLSLSFQLCVTQSIIAGRERKKLIYSTNNEVGIFTRVRNA